MNNRLLYVTKKEVTRSAIRSGEGNTHTIQRVTFTCSSPEDIIIEVEVNASKQELKRGLRKSQTIGYDEAKETQVDIGDKTLLDIGVNMFAGF